MFQVNFPFYIAKRYLFAKKSHNVINVISMVSAAGMAIGTAALVIILSVYNGFDDLICRNMTDVAPDIKVVPAQGKTISVEGQTFDAIKALPQVSSVSKVIEENVFLNYAGRQAVALAKGVDSIYMQSTPLKKHLKEGTLDLYFGDLPQCCIGAGLSYSLCAHPHFSDRMTLYYPKRGERISMASPMQSLQSVELFPGGVITVDVETDNRLLVLPLDQMRLLTGYEHEVSALEVRLHSGKDTKSAIRAISSILGPDYQVLDRYAQNPELYRMMRYEKMAIFGILIFVIILIAFNVFGSLSMLIIEKQDDMQVLRAMGADNNAISRIFVLEGWMISLFGMIVGLVLGIAATLAQQYLGIIKMPGNYLVDYYPVVLKLTDVLLTVAGVAAVGYLIALTARARTSDPRREA